MSECKLGRCAEPSITIILTKASSNTSKDIKLRKAALQNGCFCKLWLLALIIVLFYFGHKLANWFLPIINISGIQHRTQKSHFWLNTWHFVILSSFLPVSWTTTPIISKNGGWESCFKIIKSGQDSTTSTRITAGWNLAQQQ